MRTNDLGNQCRRELEEGRLMSNASRQTRESGDGCQWAGCGAELVAKRLLDAILVRCPMPMSKGSGCARVAGYRFPSRDVHDRRSGSFHALDGGNTPGAAVTIPASND